MKTLAIIRRDLVPAPPCLECGTASPLPGQACPGSGGVPSGHYVGVLAGCRSCGRLRADCAVEPCSAMRGSG